MNSAIDKPEEQKTALVWGRLWNITVAGFLLATGVWQQDSPLHWMNLFCAGVFIWKACTYQPSRVDTATSEAARLGGAVAVLVLMPMLTLALMFGLDGVNSATMWGILLVEIVIPGFFVWRHFRSRKP